jgi:hypothetical protein
MLARSSSGFVIRNEQRNFFSRISFQLLLQNYVGCNPLLSVHRRVPESPHNSEYDSPNYKDQPDDSHVKLVCRCIWAMSVGVSSAVYNR